jgi:hypothetical protein
MAHPNIIAVSPLSLEVARIECKQVHLFGIATIRDLRLINAAASYKRIRIRFSGYVLR